MFGLLCYANVEQLHVLQIIMKLQRQLYAAKRYNKYEI